MELKLSASSDVFEGSGLTNQLLLVVEDDLSLREALHYNLIGEGFRVVVARDGTSALRIARELQPDLIVLDLLLPGLDGLDVCNVLRSEGNVMPILMLTARDAVTDRVAGLRVGADDYLTKPFSMDELVARVKALIRRVELNRSETEVISDQDLVFDGLEIRRRARIVLFNGNPLYMRPKEFDLLLYMAIHKGEVITRSQLLEKIWGYTYSGASRTVDVHVRWLRTKIESDPANPKMLVTVRGAGYRIEG